MHTEPMRWLAVYQRRLVVRTGKPCWKYTQPGETLRSKDNDVRWLDRIIVPRQTETEVTSYTSCCDIQRQRRVYQRAVKIEGHVLSPAQTEKAVIAVTNNNLQYA